MVCSLCYGFFDAGAATTGHQKSTGYFSPPVAGERGERSEQIRHSPYGPENPAPFNLQWGSPPRLPGSPPGEPGSPPRREGSRPEFLGASRAGVFHTHTCRRLLISRLSLIKQESQERRFKIHTAKTMNGSDHAGTKGNAAPMPRWVAIAAPPVQPVFAPAAAAPRRPRPFAPARQRVALLARRSVPPVALSRPAASKDGARVRSAFAQPRALFVPFNGRVAPEERGTICG